MNSPLMYLFEKTEQCLDGVTVAVYVGQELLLDSRQ